MEGAEDLKQDELERKIQHWEGFLSGIQAMLHADVAELLVKLPPEMQAVMFGGLKGRDMDPRVWELTCQLISSHIAPMIERFIADLRSLQDDGG